QLPHQEHTFFTPLPPPPRSTLFPYTTLFRSLRQAADGTVEAVKYPQDGAGVITSLTETAGLVELLEDVTTVEPGATVVTSSSSRSEEHTSELQSRGHLVCRLLLEKKKHTETH